MKDRKKKDNKRNNEYEDKREKPVCSQSLRVFLHIDLYSYDINLIWLVLNQI